jgi:hypothetical protein
VYKRGEIIAEERGNGHYYSSIQIGMDQVKSIFQSRTFWFNVICVVVGASATIGANELTELGISGLAQKWALVVLGAVSTIGNIYLRAITSQPVALKKVE